MTRGPCADRKAPSAASTEGFTFLHRCKETMMDTPNVSRFDELFEYFEGGMGALIWFQLIGSYFSCP